MDERGDRSNGGTVSSSVTGLREKPCSAEGEKLLDSLSV